jgi:serine/threonine protein kinase
MKTLILITILIVILLIVYKGKESFGIISDCNEITPILDTVCDWEIGRFVGSGEKADVYSVSCGDTSLDAVIKVTRNAKHFHEEVQNQILAGDDIAPSVIDAFICDNKGYIVMENMDTSLKNHIRKLTSEPSERVDLVNEFRRVAKTKFITALQRGVFHQDTHVDNMMIKGDKLYFIDWGISKSVDLDDLSDTEVREKLEDIDATFDLLVKTINTIESKTPSAPSKKRPTKSNNNSEPQHARRMDFEDSPVKRRPLFE